MNNLYLCSRIGITAFFCIILLFSAARAETLTIGTISADPVDEARAFKPLADYLVSQMSDDGVDQVGIKIASDITEAVDMLKSKEIDFFIDSSVTALIVNKLAGSKFLLRRWKKIEENTGA